MNNLPIAKESFPFLVSIGIITLLVFHFQPWLSVIPGMLLFFIAFFFRNPPRNIKINESVALSPADGVVLDVHKVRETVFLQQDVWKITIFLNIFNVHFNRTPVSGVVQEMMYVPGKFLPAFKSHVSEINERNYVMINSGKSKVMVCQITGFIARRIVCWAKKGDYLKQGDRFGMIKFGSCTEVYLPLDCTVVVDKGEKVKGGLTVIGRWD